MKSEIKDECYLLSLRGYNGKEIAQKLNLSEATVSRAINSITKSHDYQLAMKTIGQFIEEYVRAGDFLKMQISDLERMEPEDQATKLKIMDMQADRWIKIVENVRQGQVVQALRVLRDGKLQPKPTES